MSLHNRSGMAALAAGVVVALAGPAQAGLLVIGDPLNSTENTGCDFTAQLDYLYNGGNSGTLSVLLTNTTSGSIGGFITAFVFNIASSDPGRAGVLFSTTDPDFEDAGGESANPFGSPFDAGASTSGGFEGGGPPSRGIGVGSSATFVFDITASDAGSLDETSFINGPYAFDFIVRFRGLVDGGSDKVPGKLIPAPGGAAALLCGAGLMSLRRRR